MHSKYQNREQAVQTRVVTIARLLQAPMATGIWGAEQTALKSRWRFLAEVILQTKG
jgi:hypothetical protein